MINQAIIPYLGGLTNDYAHTVVDDKTLTYLCAGVNFNSGAMAAELGYYSCKEFQIVLIAPVSLAVIAYCLYAGVKQQHLERSPCRRISRQICINGFKQVSEHYQFSLNITELRYLSPVSGRRATMVLP